jgi:hypothetical protein
MNLHFPVNARMRLSTLLILACVVAPLSRSVEGAGSSARAPQAAPVRARFDLASPAGGPFPSDRFTVADPSHNTGRRVNMPRPDCAVRVSDCEDLDVINTLDGFNLQPRLSIPFDGLIDVATVSSRTVFLVPLGSTLPGGPVGGQVVGINQIVWDVATTTLHVESDDLLEQHTRYALIVTRGVRDRFGAPVEASEAFLRVRTSLAAGQPLNGDQEDYGQSLRDALAAARGAGTPDSEVVSASVFTTQSVTAVLEKIRDQLKAATPEPADFLLGPNGERTVFDLEQLTGISYSQQTRVDPPEFNPVNLNLALLRIRPSTVRQIAFGRYRSPDFAVHPGEFIPPVGTRTGTPAVQSTNDIYFDLVLPSGPKPPGGWPVVMFLHGNGNGKNAGNTLLNVASSMATQGIATIGINAVGHGFGPLSTLTVARGDGEPLTFAAGGRSIDQDRNGVFVGNEGLFAPAPWVIIRGRDGFRQTTVDHMQLMRVIEAGMDVDGDAAPDLDPSRVYSLGQSLGGSVGTLLVAVEPGVRAGVMSVAGAGIENQRQSLLFRPSIGAELAGRVPPLLNAAGATHYGGIAFPAPRFHENLPPRDGLPLVVQLADGTEQVIRSPVTNTVAGAMAIQEFVEQSQWVFQAGDPAAYAPHLRKHPLAGVSARPVLYQFDAGDQTVPNPVTTALLRAGDLADRTSYYRHDLAVAEDPMLPKNPHPFMVSTLFPNPLVMAVARGLQEQSASFFATDGATVSHPEPARLFEAPIVGPLPERLNFIP